MASSEILALCFSKYRYLAFAIAVLGYYVGMVVWPTTSQILFDKYGYSQAMGIMATVHIIHLVAGLLFFQPQDEPEDTKPNTQCMLSFSVQNITCPRLPASPHARLPASKSWYPHYVTEVYLLHVIHVPMKLN